MLWLSGLMGLLAVGAFTLLWFLPIRRSADDATVDEVTDFGLGQKASDTGEQIAAAAEEAADEPAPASFQDVFEDETEEMSVVRSADDLFEDPRRDPAACADDGAVSEDADPGEPDEPDEEEFSLSGWNVDESIYAPLYADLADMDEVEEDATAADLDAGSDAELDAGSDTDMDDWFLAGAGTADFEDFDPQEDDLVVVWDDAGGPEPRVRIVRNDEDPALARVLMDDVILAQFRTRADIDYDHVSLVPLSAARSLGWARP